MLKEEKNEQKNQTAGERVKTSAISVDELFEKAAQLIIDKDKASIGMLQRAFKIGFNRAARIMDQLEECGIVGEEEGTKPRAILMSLHQFDEYISETDVHTEPWSIDPVSPAAVKSKEDNILRHQEQILSLLPEKREIEYITPSTDELRVMAWKLTEVLATFDVSVTMTEINIDTPAFIRFEMKLRPGTRVSKIKSLAAEIKLYMPVKYARIEAPIPGKDTVAIILSNDNTTGNLSFDMNRSGIDGLTGEEFEQFCMYLPLVPEFNCVYTARDQISSDLV